MNVIDLFAGCGGFSLGFSQAGCNVRTAVEIDPDIAETYRKNHTDTHVIVDDVRNVDIFQRGDSDIIIGGPPCQGFSMAGARIRAGFVDDPRNYLFRRYVEIVSIVRPQMFVMENVKGLCTFRNGAILEEIMERFSSLTPPYYVYPRLVNAQDFGIPQKRERLLLIGTVRPIEDMDALWERTRTELLAEDAHYFDHVSVQDAIGNLPPAAWNGTVSNPFPQTRYQQYLATADSALHNHTRSRHSALAVDRMCRVGNGQDASALNEPINSIYGGAYGRLCWDKPAPTITTRFDTPAAGRFTHPDENRTLTPREAARIQSFPDNYVFYGKRTSVCKQIGNAVPPKISYFLARLAQTILSADLSGYCRRSAVSCGLPNNRRCHKMQVKFSFAKAAVERRGYTLEAVHQTVKSLFAAHNLPCVSDSDILAFEDKGHGDDFACMWDIILSLLRADWFMDCATACVWQDEDGEEDVLAQAGKMRGAV